MKRNCLFTYQGIFVLFLILFTSQLTGQEVYRPLTVNFLEAARYEKAHPPQHKKEEKAENNMQRLPGDLPLPAGAQIKPFTLPKSATDKSSQQVLLQASPTPTTSFLGIADNNRSIPPDGGGAIGPNHVFAAENHKFVIRDKSGNEISSVSPVTFFDGLVPDFSADPHVKYDQYSKRWIVVGQSDVTTTSSVVMAVSQTDDPTGTYNKYVFRIDPDSAQVADFPLVGYNKKWIVITTNLFNIELTGATGTSLFVLDKNAVYKGDDVAFGSNAFRQLSGTPEGFNPCPAVMYSEDSVGDDMYLLQTWNSSAGILRLSKINGELPNITWPANVIFPKFATGWENVVNDGDIAPQKDDTRKINAGDARMQTVFERNGLLWGCQNIFLNNKALIQWMQLSPTGNIIQTGRINSGNVFRAFPSLAVSPNESVLIGYSNFSGNTYGSAAYSYRNAGTPYNTLDNEIIYKEGLASYYKTFGGNRNRWGDYSSTAVDPVTGDLWTKQEYAEAKVGTGTNSSRYATWWAMVKPDYANVSLDAGLTSVLSPIGGGTFCNGTISPKVILRNTGKSPLTSVTIGMQLDGTPVSTPFLFTGNLASFASTDITLNSFPVSVGNHTLKVFTRNPNGATDQRTLNDTISVTFTVLPLLDLPVTLGFESGVFPPSGGWSIFNSDGDVTWQRTIQAAKTGSASMRINAFEYETLKAVDIFKSPRIDVSVIDSLNISFDVAYARFSTEAVDTLEVVYSVDCGETWLPTGYKKWGAALATNGGTFVKDNIFVPTGSQWRRESVKLGTCSINSKNILAGIKFTSNFGQACYIDNLTFASSPAKRRNVQLVSIDQPAQATCANAIVPEVTIYNQGGDTIKTLNVTYRLDNESPVTFNFAGALQRCNSQTVTLSTISANVGAHQLTVYVSDPNGVTDEFTGNDTLVKSFTVSPVVDAPVVENFESPGFPPNNWAVVNPDGGITWERTTTAAKDGIASMVIRNFDNPRSKTTDQFISPVVRTASTADSVFVSFDYAYAPGAAFPGSTVLPLDTLEIWVSADCGVTFTTVWKEWGEDLQTVNNPNNSSSTAFTPAPNQWRSIRLYLSNVVGSQNFQVYFVNKGNKQNNLYVDNINIFSVTRPPRLTSQGYLIYPNPFSTSIVIQHLQAPQNLRSISVYNSVGQLVSQQQYNGDASTTIITNLSKLSRGVYIVKLSYTDRFVVERVLKN